MNGYCNCGKKATTEWLITKPAKRGRCSSGSTIKLCDTCKPKHEMPNFQIIYGKK